MYTLDVRLAEGGRFASLQTLSRLNGLHCLQLTHQGVNIADRSAAAQPPAAYADATSLARLT